VKKADANVDGSALLPSNSNKRASQVLLISPPYNLPPSRESLDLGERGLIPGKV